MSRPLALPHRLLRAAPADSAQTHRKGETHARFLICRFRQFATLRPAVAARGAKAIWLMLGRHIQQHKSKIMKYIQIDKIFNLDVLFCRIYLVLNDLSQSKSTKKL
ncbi:MAG: hypothetical protein KBS79_05135, partial [Lachnospiraceae bacterium]|nr:hypothetical protein [Candidatus Minthocola equi]